MKRLLFTFCLVVTGMAYAQEYSPALLAAKYDIDRAWTDYSRPDAFRVCLPEESYRLRKANISDHACIVNAIRSAKSTGTEAAIDWLTAAQCRNPGAQDRVRKAGIDAVRYVMNTYSSGEEDIAGYTTLVAPPPPAELNINFTNRTGERVYMYSLMTDQATGKRNCQDYTFGGNIVPNRSSLHIIPKGKYMWVRFKKTQSKDGCGSYMKEYKVGLTPDQNMTVTQEIIIQ